MTVFPKPSLHLITIITIIVLFLAACGLETSAPVPTQVEQLAPTQTFPSKPSPTVPPPAVTEAPAEPSNESTPLPTQIPAVEVLPAEPQEIEFQAEDGQSLIGRYYPSAVSPAPLVVLMHWAPGDQNDWAAIATWLQNRGGRASTSGDKPWLDSSWFPALLEGQSFAVFTFTFRNCEGGCKSFDRAEWLLDAQSAMRIAYGLEGVNPNRIATIGASIGADGAPDGCAWLNTQFPNSCLGALSLSPGGYLTIPYKDAVSDLGSEQPPKPAWCLYAEGDAESAQACEAASGDNYRSVKYSGNHHGMMLVQPELEPSALQIMLDFLKLAFGL